MKNNAPHLFVPICRFRNTTKESKRFSPQRLTPHWFNWLWGHALTAADDMLCALPSPHFHPLLQRSMCFHEVFRLRLVYPPNIPPCNRVRQELMSQKGIWRLKTGFLSFWGLLRLLTSLNLPLMGIIKLFIFTRVFHRITKTKTKTKNL